MGAYDSELATLLFVYYFLFHVLLGISSQIHAALRYPFFSYLPELDLATNVP